MQANRKLEEVRKEIKLPPTWCASICRNAMNDVCVEQCARHRNSARFELKPGLALIDMPRFPLKAWLDDMSKAEKGIAIAVYLSKMIDYLQSSERTA